MNNKKWLDLAMKYGGYMVQDRVFLENRLSNLTEESEKRLLATPPASVLNAYFAELYQKKSPKTATDYFFNLSRDLEIFQAQPNFHLEGQAGTENFRFIRLNLSGQSFGFCYRNDKEEAVVFSEFPLKLTTKLFFDISEIFPQYLVSQEQNQILMKAVKFDSDFEEKQELSNLTERAENAQYIRLSGYNIEELLEFSEQIGYLSPLQFQREGQKFNLYIRKAF